jgi:hypothetical protein
MGAEHDSLVRDYTNLVDVIETNTLKLVGRFPTKGCAQGIAFSADSRVISAPDGKGAVANLRLDLAATKPAASFYPWSSLSRAPDGSILLVTCDDTECSSSGLAWTHGGRHLSVSAEGQWLALGGKLLHTPSGEQRTFDEMASEAIFAPNGDIIAGERDGSLVRFCRSDSAP